MSIITMPTVGYFLGIQQLLRMKKFKQVLGTELHVLCTQYEQIFAISPIPLTYQLPMSISALNSWDFSFHVITVLSVSASRTLLDI